MGTRSAQLKAHIDKLESEHLTVSMEGKTAIAQMGERPQDGARLISQANKCFERASAIRRDLDNYDVALEEAERLDRADEQAAFAKKNMDRLVELKRLTDERIDLATRVDQALAALDVAQTAFARVSARISGLAQSCVDTSGLLPCHRVELLDHVRQIARGAFVDLSDPDHASLETLAIDAASALHARLDLAKSDAQQRLARLGETA